MELADALPRQAAVVELQDVPDVYRDCADLLGPHVVFSLHGAMATADFQPVYDGGDGRLEDGQHGGSVVGSAFSPRRLPRVTRAQRAQVSFHTLTKSRAKTQALTFCSGERSQLSFGDDNFNSVQSENFSLNKTVSLCSVSLPNMAQSGRPWPFLCKAVQLGWC